MARSQSPSREPDPIEAEKIQAQEFGSDQYDDPVEARRIRRKIDFRLLPLLIILYTLSFLDRVNIGNARLWSLEEDLDMDGYDYNIAVLIFYIPHILFSVPANMIMTRVTPRYWIGGLTIAWGLCVTMVGFTKSFAGLAAVRVLLGALEAGMFPACMYLINTWYRRHEIVTRMAFFMLSNDIAGVLSGLLGAGLGSLDGTGGYSGWSWIFFVEGAATVLAGIFALFFVLDFPENSSFLPPDEKAWVLRRINEDDGGPTGKMTVKGVLASLSDWKVLSSGVLYLACCNTAGSVAVFAPTILATFGWDSMKANLLSAPIRVASGITAVAVGISSDKLRLRGPFCCAGFLISIFGNLCVMLFHNGPLRYMGLYFTAMGVMGVQPLVIGWCINQVVGVNKRGTVTAFSSAMGQIGGVVSAVAFPKKDGPQYIPGTAVNVALLGAGLVAAVWLWAWARWENRQREMGRRDHLRQLPESEQALLGEKHPDYRFTP